MNEKTDLEKFFNGFLKRAKMANGKVIGEDGDIIESKLGKDDREAWVNHLAEQYLKKEKLDTPPDEFNIINQDIIDELARREISKILGK